MIVICVTICKALGKDHAYAPQRTILLGNVEMELLVFRVKRFRQKGGYDFWIIFANRHRPWFGYLASCTIAAIP